MQALEATPDLLKLTQTNGTTSLKFAAKFGFYIGCFFMVRFCVWLFGERSGLFWQLQRLCEKHLP